MNSFEKSIGEFGKVNCGRIVGTVDNKSLEVRELLTWTKPLDIPVSDSRRTQDDRNVLAFHRISDQQIQT